MTNSLIGKDIKFKINAKFEDGTFRDTEENAKAVLMYFPTKEMIGTFATIGTVSPVDFMCLMNMICVYILKEDYFPNIMKEDAQRIQNVLYERATTGIEHGQRYH